MTNKEEGMPIDSDLNEIARSGERIEDAGIDEADMQEKPLIEISPGAAED
jgi:hypothetical protein